MNTPQSMLQSLGFSTNEAKAYVALLQNQGVTAYELSKQAGIPSSKIYETVGRLTDRGVVRPVMAGDTGKQRYAALPPEDMLQRIMEDTRSRVEALAPLLSNLHNDDAEDLIWPVAEDEVRALAQSIVQGATQTLLVSAWPEEIRWLQQTLEDCADRGTRLALVHFGVPTVSIGATYHHPVEKTLYQEKGGRGLTLVADGNVVLIANFHDDGGFDGAWSRNPSFVTVAEDYIKHDVYITKVTRFLDAEMKQRFGSEYERLRDVFNQDA